MHVSDVIVGSASRGLLVRLHDDVCAGGAVGSVARHLPLHTSAAPAQADVRVPGKLKLHTLLVTSCLRLDIASACRTVISLVALASHRIKEQPV